MPAYRKIFLLLVTIVLLAGCKHKKKPSLSGDDLVDVKDFIAFFEPVNLPYQFSDTILQKKGNDSLLISFNVFTRFVPDSILSKIYGKEIKPKIYALGKTTVPKAETYLFIKTVTTDKKAVLILSFDNKNKFITSLTALLPDNNNATVQSVIMDKRYIITKTVTLKNADGSVSDGKDVYVLNASAKSFKLIMTDALSDKITELMNPIDTLPVKNKLSADYVNGKMNLVSIRDGRRNGLITFYIHFEKNNGECSGELKGEATLKSPTTAEYRENGDPCVLNFIFSPTAVTLKEKEGCGSRRGLNCAFDGSFARKKNAKLLLNSKKKAKK